MIGIIGGTGLYNIEELKGVETHAIETPFGGPSSSIAVGYLEDQKVAFLPRHGSHHQRLPSEINFRANIWALKYVGVKQVIGVSAVGSLNEDIPAGALVIPDQYFDFTKGRRVHTFFGNGLVAHISTAEPTCPSLTTMIRSACEQLGCTIQTGKTYACIEGPRLGTRAESFFLKGAGCDVVGMTNVPEVFLAREAQLCYCTIAVVTDYDCWLEDPKSHVTVDKAMALYKTNLGRVQAILKKVIADKHSPPTCDCHKSLEGAVLSKENTLTEDNKQILRFLKS